MRAALLLSLFVGAGAASGQTAGDLPFVGRWLAVEVPGDATATADLAHGHLEKILVVHPGGRVLLRGTDHAQGAGRPQQFVGRIDGDALRLDGLPGAARLRAEGRRLVMVDPRGVETVYLRWPLDDADLAHRLMR